MAWINTELFRTEARHFQKYGYYCPDPPGSAPWFDYWTEQMLLCRNGYSVGGKKITGKHYGYLNFAQIKLTEQIGSGERVLKEPKRAGRKTVNFPDFWDGDYDYFWNYEIARWGMKKEEMEKLDLICVPVWLDGGHHMLVFKSRRKGFSFKNGWVVTDEYNTIRDSICLVGAYETKYLYPEGTMKMVTDYMNFLNEHTAWVKRRQAVDKTSHRKASFFEYFNGQPIEKGYKSQVIAVSFKDNPDAARGKDASLILLEEGGKFPNLKASYMATKPTVEDGGITTGFIVIFGTGGDMEVGTVDMESMFYNPEPYNLMPYNNIWDEGGSGTICCYFFPDRLNKVGFIDKNGNSLQNEARESWNATCDQIKRTARNQEVLDRYMTEYPQTPRQGFLQHSSNLFPTATVQAWRNTVQVKGLYKHMAVHGKLRRGEKGVEFRPSDNVKPILKFPHDHGDFLDGCVTIYQMPHRLGDHVPDNMYIIVHDPYAQDGQGGQSLGAAYVIKRINPLSPPDDCIVASYVGRPTTQDEYNENLFMLAEFYNAKIGFENDRGDVIGYAKRFRKLHWLLSEVEIVDKTENVNIRKLGRRWGTSMGTLQRKEQAEIYFRDWLITKRGQDEQGEHLLNLHLIYDIALLDEIIQYHTKGNFDRVSAMLVGMYHLKDMHRKEVISEPARESNSFWDRDFF
jgi:hypothetical protein